MAFGKRKPIQQEIWVATEDLPRSPGHAFYDKLYRLLKGKTLGIDSTMLEANTAMKTIVRKESGDDWMEYLRKLYAE